MLEMLCFTQVMVLLTLAQTLGAEVQAQELIAMAEVQVLHGLHSATAGDDWAWRAPEQQLGKRWNFSTDSSGAYLHNPCSDENQTWQGVWCSASPNACSNQTCSVVKIDLQGYNLHGEIPDEWGSLVQLQEITLWQNSLSGTLPKTLSTLVNMAVINLEENSLRGGFPVEYCRLPYLAQLRLGRNFLTGPLSPEVTGLAGLQWLSLYENLFTGPIIPEIGQLPYMQRLYLFDNMFTGQLQPSLAQLQYLGIYAVHANFLTGTLIPELASHPYLQVLSLQECHFTGTVPPELSNLQSLNHLYMFLNELTGTVPASFSTMTRLLRLSISQNRLTGHLPPDMGNMVNLRYLYLYENMFSGPIPTGLGSLTEMVLFSAYNNRLSGPLAPGFSNMTKLNRLLLQNNKLTGSINNEAAFSSNMEFLEIVDLSNNKLSGSVPKTLFSLPRVTTIALSLNCFQGNLPEDMCSVRDLQVLSMDGLGAAQGCRHEYKLPITGVAIFNTLDGTVPPCLWNLHNLTVLHLASNGLYGSIMDRGPTSHESSVMDLSLSHNHLTGTIPRHIRSSNFSFLDLSYNKLTGKHQDSEGRHSTYVNPAGSELILEVNRLSGPLPSDAAFHVVKELRLLRDNLFSCDHIPGQDEYSAKYSCGSQNLNMSVYFFLAFGVLCLLVYFLAMWTTLSGKSSSSSKNVFQRLHSFASRQRGYYTLFNIENVRNMQCVELIKIYNMQDILRFTIVLLFLLLFTLVLVGLPLYIIKLSEYGGDGYNTYSTHSYQYLWVISMAYISGTVPATLIIIAWLVVFGSCYILFAEWEFVASLISRSPLSSLAPHGGNGKNSFRSDRSSSESDVDLIVRQRQLSIEENKKNGDEKLKAEPWSGFICLFAINFIIEWVINISFVYSSYKPLSPSDHTLCQVALAVCKTLHNSMILPMLTAKLVTSNRLKMRIRLIMSIFNCVFIPGIATTFTSPACFQNLIMHADEISSAYSYKFCSLYEFNADGTAAECMEVTTEAVDIIPIIPPFSYNNQCFSVLLTTYIPVYVFVYTFQAISPFFLVPLFTNINFLSLPKSVRKPGLAIGLCWPSFWRKNVPEATSTMQYKDESANASEVAVENEDISTARILFDHKKFYLKIAYHLTILLTFGICCPVLAAIVVVSLALQIVMHVYLVGRFVEQRLGTRELEPLVRVDDHAIYTLSTIHVDIHVFHHLVWPLLWGSAVFFAFMTWDIVIDETDDWKTSMWAPGVCMGIPVILWVVVNLKSWLIKRHESQVNSSLLAPHAAGVVDAHEFL